MARDLIEKARQERNAALVDAMMLAGSADGTLGAKELEMMVARIVERPEFEGTRANELRTLVEQSAARLSQMKSLDAVCQSLRERLPERRQRVLAFGLACAVALADHQAKREELGLLKTLQAALGISEDEVQQCFDVVQRGGSLSEVVGEPLERLYAEVMVLVSAADGVVHEQELLAMLESMAADPTFQGVSVRAAEGHLREAVSALATEGMTQRLAVLAKGLTTHAQRKKAYALAVRVAWADGQHPTPKEQHTLELLQATFGLADDEVRALSLGARA